MNFVKHQIMMVVTAFVLSILLGGCRYTHVPTKSPVVPLVQSRSFVSPQPSSNSASVHGFLSSPSSGRATIVGRLVRNIGSNSEPMAHTKILLAKVIFSEDGTPIVAAASEETSPMTVTDHNGVFVFRDVAPDTYSVAIVTPIGIFIIRDDAGKDFIFTIQAGAVLDLGEIRTNLPY